MALIPLNHLPGDAAMTPERARLWIIKIAASVARDPVEVYSCADRLIRVAECLGDTETAIKAIEVVAAFDGINSADALIDATRAMLRFLKTGSHVRPALVPISGEISRGEGANVV